MKGSVKAACYALGGTLLMTSTVLAQATNTAQPRTTQPNTTQAQPGVQTAPGQQGSGRTTTATQGQGQSQVDDRSMAACVAIKNQAEVAITQFAKDKLKNDEVKEFADMLIKDHQEFLQKLQKFTPEANRANWLQAEGSTKTTTGVQQAGAQGNRSGQIQQTAGTTAQGQSQGQSAEFLQIQREIAQQCVMSAKEKLKEYEDNIDACFLGLQAGKHMAMADELTVLHRHASGELKQLLADGLETTKSHLEKAESLMKDVKHDDKSSSKKNSDRSEKSEKSSDKAKQD
jgi:predicted outer membrane protein